MQRFVNRTTSIVVIAALLAGPAGTSSAFAQQTAEDLNRAMQQEIARDQAEAIAAEEARKAAEEQARLEAQMSPREREKLEKERQKAEKKRLKAERKAREKAERDARRAEKARLKEEKKAREEAERAARRAEGGGDSRVGNAIGGCVGGAVLGGLAGMLLGGKKNRGKSALAGAAAGCAAGVVFGLSRKEEEELNDYVANDYGLRDDVDEGVFYAEETQQQIMLQKSEVVTEDVQHQFVLADGVTFRPGNILVNERYMRSTASSLRMRGSPTTQADNVVGEFSPNDKMLTYGTTQDGEWTYIVQRQGGEYTLLGYASSDYLTTNLDIPPRQKVQVAKARPSASPPKTKPAAVSSGSAQSKKRVATYTAPTKCKNIVLSSGGKSTSGKQCGGGGGFQMAGNISSSHRKAAA